MINIGIIGATGLVGEELIKLFEEENNKNFNLVLFSSTKKLIEKFKKKYCTSILSEDKLKNLQYAFFMSNNEVSKKFIPIALKHNCICIDNSSQFRLYNDIPLIIPEVNIEEIKNHKLIASPNCCATILSVVLNNIEKCVGLSKVNVSTYQSASGGGYKLVSELKTQGIEYYNDEPFTTEQIGRQYIWNVFSHNSPINPNTGYNDEETKLIDETRKIFKNSFNITATCVRVPTLRSHCESVTITLRKPINLEVLKNILQNTSGIEVLDNEKTDDFPEAIKSCQNKNVLVGRIRKDFTQEKDLGYHLFISGDQLLKGASLNAFQIFQNLVKRINLDKINIKKKKITSRIKYPIICSICGTIWDNNFENYNKKCSLCLAEINVNKFK
jgi:aspartate-semialdehyde dehydrogenase